MSHTPTPWKAEPHDGVLDKGLCTYVTSDSGKYEIVAILSLHDHNTNAAFIVKAANSFDTLVETLRWVRENYAAGSTAEINARIDAALAKAGA